MLSPSLSFSDSFSLYLSTPFYFSFPRTLTLYYNPLLSSSLSAPLFSGPVARATLSRSGTARVRPRVVPSDVPAATCQFPSVVCLRAAASCRKARGESRDRWSIGIFLCLQPPPFGAGEPLSVRRPAGEKKCNALPRIVSRHDAEMRTGDGGVNRLCRCTVRRRRCGMCNRCCVSACYRRRCHGDDAAVAAARLTR